MSTFDWNFQPSVNWAFNLKLLLTTTSFKKKNIFTVTTNQKCKIYALPGLWKLELRFSSVIFVWHMQKLKKLLNKDTRSSIFKFFTAKRQKCSYSKYIKKNPVTPLVELSRYLNRSSTELPFCQPHIWIFLNDVLRIWICA